MASVGAEVDASIRTAIAQRRLLRFDLYGRPRIVEPHDYGVRGGVVYLLAYQVGGESRSGGLPQWRWVKVEQIRDVRLLDDTFPGRRPVATGGHARWDELYARVAGEDG